MKAVLEVGRQTSSAGGRRGCWGGWLRGRDHRDHSTLRPWTSLASSLAVKSLTMSRLDASMSLPGKARTCTGTLPLPFTRGWLWEGPSLNFVFPHVKRGTPHPSCLPLRFSDAQHPAVLPKSMTPVKPFPCREKAWAYHNVLKLQRFVYATMCLAAGIQKKC